MDVRIGMSETNQIIEVDLDDETDREVLQTQVQEVLTGEAPIFKLVDRRGKELAVAGNRVAWIELGSAANDRRIGFGA